MSDADARNKASAFLEKENLLNNKTEQDNVAEA
jgi:hypothetical protein